MAVKFNKDLIAELARKDTEEKAKKALSDEERMKDLYQGKEHDLIIGKFLEGKSVNEDIDISLLDDYENNYFHRLDGEEWERMVGSIKSFGILTPLIVRPKGERFEILAGHNRKYAAQEAGLTKVPCRTLDVDDVTASVIVGITNNQREDTSDLEWGWSYRNTLEKIKHQGKATSRHDGEKSENDAQATSRHDGEKSEKGKTSISVVAEMYGIGERTAQRKIRLTYLLSQLYDALERINASQGMMVDLSYLTKTDQANLAHDIATGSLVITDEIAQELKRIALEKDGADIGIDNLLRFCRERGEVIPKVQRPKKYMVEESLFPKSLKKGDRQSYIEKALSYILENGIELTVEKGGDE